MSNLYDKAVLKWDVCDPHSDRTVFINRLILVNTGGILQQLTISPQKKLPGMLLQPIIKIFFRSFSCRKWICFVKLHWVAGFLLSRLEYWCLELILIPIPVTFRTASDNAIKQISGHEIIPPGKTEWTVMYSLFGYIASKPYFYRFHYGI